MATQHRVRIAHITTVDLALRYLLLNQLCSIQRAGYEVVGISSAGPEVPAIHAAGIRHIPVVLSRRFTPLADLVSLWRLFRVIRREEFVIVHTHTPKASLLGQLAARLAGVPIVVNTVHGFYFHDGMSSLWRGFYMSIERIAGRLSDVILSQNREDIHIAISRGICPPEKIKHLGNGIDVRRFDPKRITHADLARKSREVGLPSSGPVIGFVGRLVREKGLLDLFEATRMVKETVPGVRLLIVGPVDLQKPDAIRPETAHRYGIGDICHFLGLRQDMPELYALMDVLVLPSHREGFPRAPMEASAMKVPCVVTDVRGCREVVERGRNGLLVPLGDTRALATAIIELLTDRRTAQRMGEEGRRMALERFDEQAVFAKVLGEYARLLRDRGIVAAE